MEKQPKEFSVPLPVIVGDEDDPCLDGSLFIKRTAPTAALLSVAARRPRGSTAKNLPPSTGGARRVLAAAEADRWLAHKAA
jgi:hypothetical protein